MMFEHTKHKNFHLKIISVLKIYNDNLFYRKITYQIVKIIPF
ncbi:hypothetical protein Xmir_03904 [Xenorhabdus miraniensis]|uniref:Uncharacterized protein n=1 Tax=Xenorhabdus miraniensis TaxID=351674 RepID=A0A2D0JKE8_9GAMM|nr:hypothetical protein Xmir_03904 [Xenorhabdus miraniensis]